MARGMRRRDRAEFKDGMRVIDEYVDVLSEAGLWSRGLSELYGMNFNRPDRDDPDSVSVDAIMDIYEANE